MINRVLIRMKVVQMLFCYFLNRNEFHLYPAPESASRDKIYAYNFYLDLLLMALRLSGYKVGQSTLVFSNKYISDNRIGRALKADPAVKATIFKRSADAPRFDSALEAIYDQITKSAIYRSYTHRKEKSIQDDIDFWSVLINSIFMKCQDLLTAARTDENFTNVGYEAALQMMDATIRSCGDARKLLVESKNSLRRSLDKGYELYNRLLALPGALVELQDRRLDAGRHKYLVTAEDLNPNMKFVDNRMVKILAGDEKLSEYCEENHINWMDDIDFLQGVLDDILKSEIYQEYMASESSSLEADCDFWRQIMKRVILPSDRLADLLEDKSVFWNDDVDIIGTFVLKTFRKIGQCTEEDQAESCLLPQFKDKEDERFGEHLFTDTVDNFESYRAYIDKFINANSWDPERLAFMDVIIMSAAISELINFPAIPVPVTLNEYIEIANYYSTPRSGQFINGILFSVINHLREEGAIQKK